MKDNLSNIPAELQDLPQWVVWKADKHPRNALTGANASTSDPSTWSSFQVAQDQVTKGRFSGVGFVFTENDPYVGIDLDKIIDDNGDIDSEAQAIIDKLNSYTEISQGGHGIHIIVIGKKPSTRCRKDNVEIYGKGRYFALTGNLWQDRATIEDRQEALNWLCQETFGESDAQAAPVAADDFPVLDPDAMPPPDKLDVLLKNRDFARTWKHKREDLKSLSEYDLSLAGSAYRAGWNDQEMADLAIAFRRQHGTHDDLMKALRDDYIPRTLAKVKGNTEALALLPFKVVKVIQRGEQDSEYELVLDNGQRIQMGDTEAFRSARRASNRLFEVDYYLSPQAEKGWKDIAIALRKMAEVTSTVTRDETTIAWIRGYVNYYWMSTATVEDDSERLNQVFAAGGFMARGNRGEVYLKLHDVVRHARLILGWNKTAKTTANDLASAGFTKRVLDLRVEGRRTRMAVWVSPPGLCEDSEVDE